MTYQRVDKASAWLCYVEYHKTADYVIFEKKHVKKGHLLLYHNVLGDERNKVTQGGPYPASCACVGKQVFFHTDRKAQENVASNAHFFFFSGNACHGLMGSATKLLRRWCAGLRKQRGAECFPLQGVFWSTLLSSCFKNEHKKRPSPWRRWRQRFIGPRTLVFLLRSSSPTEARIRSPQFYLQTTSYFIFVWPPCVRKRHSYKLNLRPTSDWTLMGMNICPKWNVESSSAFMKSVAERG